MHTIMAALLFLSAVIYVAAQDKKAVKQNTRDSEATTSPEEPREETSDAPASYSYEFEQPEFIVSHIIVEHDASGRGRVSFKRKGNEETYVEPLELSASALARITALWDALGFLDTEETYQGMRQYPGMGTVRLSMKRGTRERTTEFNWTTNRDASALANEYRRAADQTMFVFDITVARENQPLEAPKLMDHLDRLLSRDGLSDPHQLVALLRDLHTDERIPLIARNHAGRLLKKIDK